jgi:hypothetical protein
MRRQSISERYEREGRENARVGYQVAVNLATHEAHTLWTRSNAMLVANGIIIASIRVSLETTTEVMFFNLVSTSLLSTAIMSLVGIGLCYFWIRVVERSSTYASYWTLSARELEYHLRGPVKTLERGQRLAEGGCVEVDGERLKMSRCAQHGRTRRVPVALAFFFVGCYVLLTAIAVYQEAVRWS